MYTKHRKYTNSHASVGENMHKSEFHYEDKPRRGGVKKTDAGVRKKTRTIGDETLLNRGRDLAIQDSVGYKALLQ